MEIQRSDPSVRDLLGLREVSQRTSLSYSTVKTLVARGKIRSVTVGRRRLVHHADLEEWADGLRKGRINGGEPRCR
jgi:excisionase family DNA binding protein